MKNARGFLGGAIWLTISALILKVIGLIYKIPLSYMIGDEGMGYFNSAYTVYTFFYIISTAGIPKSISILTAKAEAENSGTENGIFSSAFKTLTAFGLFLTLILTLFSKSFASIIGNEKSTLSILSIAPSVLFVAASGVLRGYLSGKMDFIPIAISELIAGLFKLILGLVLAQIALMRGYSVEVISAFAILGITIGSFFGTVYLGKVYLKKHGKEKNIRAENYKKNLKDILKIAIPLTATSAISSIVNILDLSIIMNGLAKSGYSDTLSTILYGNYTTLAVPMLTLVLTLVTPITTASLPTLAKDYARENHGAYLSTVNKTLSITSFFGIPCFFGFLFFSNEILSVIFEQSSAVLGAPQLSVLSFAVLLILPLTVINNALEAAGRVKVPIISLTIGAVVKLMITAVFIRKESIGILAAPLGTAVSYAISLLISYCALTTSLKEGNIIHFDSLFFSSFFSAIAIIPAIFVKKIINLNYSARLFSLVTLLIFGLIYLFLWVIFYFFKSKTKKNVSICTKNKTFSY